MAVVWHDKLVRDNIPELIAAQGKTPVVVALSDADYKVRLQKKLLEETQEYLSSGEADELADILEVVYALSEEQRVAPEELETIRMKKREERGGF